MLCTVPRACDKPSLTTRFSFVFRQSSSGGKRLIFQKKLIKIPSLVQKSAAKLGSEQPSDSVVLYVCDPCKMFFPSSNTLAIHNKKVHNQSITIVKDKRASSLSLQMPGSVKSKPVERPTARPLSEELAFSGYRRVKNGQYVCDSCGFTSIINSVVVAHVQQLHGQAEALAPKLEAVDMDDESSWPMETIDDLQVEVPEGGRLRICPYCPFQARKYSTFHSHVKRKHRSKWMNSAASKLAIKNQRINVLSGAHSKSRSSPQGTSKSPKEDIDWQEEGEQVDDEKEETEEEEEEEDEEAATQRKDEPSFLDCELDPIEKESVSVSLEEPASPNRMHKCPLCSFEALLPASLVSHMAHRHPGRKPRLRRRGLDADSRSRSHAQRYTGYACHYCTFVAATVVSINAHNAREHFSDKPPIKEVPVGEYDCDQCEYKSKSRKNMQLHLKDHALIANEEGMYACHICLYETNSKMGLQRHVSIKHNKPRREAAKVDPRSYHKCGQCDFTCLNGKTMDWHRQQHTSLADAEDGTSYFCNDCDFSTWTKGQLYMHIRRKHKDDGQKEGAAGGNAPSELDQPADYFPCEQCDYISKNKHSLKVHVIRKHTNEFNHECETCGKKYKVKADLTNHIRFQHREQPIICDVCGKTCRNSNLLYLHQKFAHYKPDFECHICHRRMVSQANLDEHVLKQHEQRQDAVCEECGKTFAKHARLKIHKRVHTGVKPYTCKICSKAFARRNGLRQHLLIHTGQRPYVCDICGKAFTQKTGLISHRKSHPGSHPPLPRVTIDHVLSELLNEEE